MRRRTIKPEEIDMVNLQASVMTRLINLNNLVTLLRIFHKYLHFKVSYFKIFPNFSSNIVFNSLNYPGMIWQHLCVHICKSNKHPVFSIAMFFLIFQYAELSMKFGDLVKSLVSLYITIWLLILKKIKDVYQLEGPNINFGIFLKVFYRSGEKPKRSISMPTIHRSTSIRERRRNKSDPLVRSSKIYDSYSTQNFSLRRKKSWENDIERGAAANSATSDLPYNNEIGKMKIKCKKSLMMARELREDKTAL